MPLAVSGVGLILTSILGFILSRSGSRVYGVSYGIITLIGATTLLTFSNRLTNILDPKQVSKLERESCYDHVFLEHQYN
jgi:hypothetical protein